MAESVNTTSGVCPSIYDVHTGDSMVRWLRSGRGKLHGTGCIWQLKSLFLIANTQGGGARLVKHGKIIV